MKISNAFADVSRLARALERRVALAIARQVLLIHDPVRVDDRVLCTFCMVDWPCREARSVTRVVEQMIDARPASPE